MGGEFHLFLIGISLAKAASMNIHSLLHLPRDEKQQLLADARQAETRLRNAEMNNSDATPEVYKDASFARIILTQFGSFSKDQASINPQISNIYSKLENPQNPKRRDRAEAKRIKRKKGVL